MRERRPAGKPPRRFEAAAQRNARFAQPARRTLFVLFPFVLVLGLARLSLAQASGCEALQAMQQKIYGFEPPSLSDQQRETKVLQLQQFWQSAKSLGSPAVPCLEVMLASDKQDPFFLYDGSSLLFSLDKSPATLAAVSTALAGTDLKDVETAAYIGFLLQLSHRDIDIGPLAAKYMKFSLEGASTPQHGAMKQDRISGAVLLYGSMQPELAEKYLERLARGADSDGRSAATFALALNMTEASFLAFHAGIRLDGLSAENQTVVRSILRYEPPPPAGHTPLSRTQVLARLASVIRGDFDHFDPDYPPYVSGDDAFEVSAGAQLLPADLPVLAEARRKSIRSVSDDSVDEYIALTHIYLEVINRYDLYKKLRARLSPEDAAKP